MKLYLIRHGQSEANVQGVYGGQGDYPLTDLGRAQAKQAGELLKEISFDKVYVSTLSRAIETARLALPDYTSEQDALLCEVSVGNLMNKPIHWCIENMGEEFLRHRMAWDFSPYGGENREMMLTRANAFLRKAEQLSCECVAAVCHAGMEYALLCAAMGFDVERYRVDTDNASISRLDYVDGVWHLVKWNISDTL